jgi:hypothetical protein
MGVILVYTRGVNHFIRRRREISGVEDWNLGRQKHVFQQVLARGLRRLGIIRKEHCIKFPLIKIPEL